MTRFPVGSRVLVDSQPEFYAAGTVTHHGRDTGGPYTRVKLDSGEELEFHRNCIKPLHGNHHVTKDSQ